MKGDFLDSVHAAVREAIGRDDRPVVAFTSAWPFMREMRQHDPAAVERLTDVLLDAVGERSLLMPTFTGGFTSGRCDLDREPSSTGVLSESFRKRPGVRRTLSAFFSFAVRGAATGELIDLKPEHAWGEGSLYEWMERRDVCFLMFGTHPTHSSYLHRLEWLAREVISYRHYKTFSGRLIREGKCIDLDETLFVRELSPPVLNDFTVLAPFLKNAGMKMLTAQGVGIASYHARGFLAEALAALRQDPFLLVKNRGDRAAHL